MRKTGFQMNLLTKHARKNMKRGIAATARRYRQPIVGIMKIDTKTMKHVPIAQNSYK